MSTGCFSAVPVRLRKDEIVKLRGILCAIVLIALTTGCSGQTIRVRANNDPFAIGANRTVNSADLAGRGWQSHDVEPGSVVLAPLVKELAKAKGGAAAAAKAELHRSVFGPAYSLGLRLWTAPDGHHAVYTKVAPAGTPEAVVLGLIPVTDGSKVICYAGSGSGLTARSEFWLFNGVSEPKTGIWGHGVTSAEGFDRVDAICAAA